MHGYDGVVLGAVIAALAAAAAALSQRSPPLDPLRYRSRCASSATPRRLPLSALTPRPASPVQPGQLGRRLARARSSHHDRAGAVA